MSVVAMYGYCDNFYVTYKKVGENRWETEVPADLSDGKYVIEIYGEDETGGIVYWAGILYMFDSRVVMLELLPDCGGMFWDSSDTIEVHSSVVQSCKRGGCVP